MSFMTVAINYSTTLEEIVDYINEFLRSVNGTLGEVKCSRAEEHIVLSIQGKGVMHFRLERHK
jgi:hypothetical protein